MNGRIFMSGSNNVCDMCGAPGRAFVLPSPPYEQPQIGLFNEGDYVVCGRCVLYVCNRDRRGLINHVSQMHRTKWQISTDEMADHMIKLVLLVDGFFQHWTGEVSELSKGVTDA